MHARLVDFFRHFCSRECIAELRSSLNKIAYKIVWKFWGVNLFNFHRKFCFYPRKFGNVWRLIRCSSLPRQISYQIHRYWTFLDLREYVVRQSHMRAIATGAREIFPALRTRCLAWMALAVIMQTCGVGEIFATLRTRCFAWMTFSVIVETSRMLVRRPANIACENRDLVRFLELSWNIQYQPSLALLLKC